MKMRWIAGAALLLLVAVACGRSATDPAARVPAGAASWSLEDDIADIPDEQADTISDGGGGGGYFGSGLRGESNDSTLRN